MVNAWYHPDDLRCRPMSSRWHKVYQTLSHRDGSAHVRISSEWFMDIAVCHPDDFRCCPMSPRWHNVSCEWPWYCPMPSGWHTVIKILCNPELASCHISSGWVMVNAGSHPYDFRCYPIPSGWHNVIQTLSHPDEVVYGRISSVWPGVWTLQYITWMTYDIALCHPDHITLFWP